MNNKRFTNFKNDISEWVWSIEYRCRILVREVLKRILNLRSRHRHFFCQHRKLETLTQLVYSYPDMRNVYMCTRCGYIFLIRGKFTALPSVMAEKISSYIFEQMLGKKDDSI